MLGETVKDKPYLPPKCVSLDLFLDLVSLASGRIHRLDASFLLDLELADCILIHPSHEHHCSPHLRQRPHTTRQTKDEKMNNVNLNVGIEKG